MTQARSPEEVVVTLMGQVGKTHKEVLLLSQFYKSFIFYFLDILKLCLFL